MRDEIVDANASNECEPYTNNGSKTVTHFVSSKPLNHEKAKWKLIDSIRKSMSFYHLNKTYVLLIEKNEKKIERKWSKNNFIINKAEINSADGRQAIRWSELKYSTHILKQINYLAIRNKLENLYI